MRDHEDDRPGKNIEHVARHGMTPELWEQVYVTATRRQPDKDNAAIEVAEGRVARRLYRIVYEVLDDPGIGPREVFPITGFRITRRALEP